MPIASISAIILAGGQGSRVGFRNKGLLSWNNRPMVDWVIDSIRTHVDDIVISANNDLESYATRGTPVISDTLTGFEGPLAGIASCFPHTRHDLILTTPCDMPLLPFDLVERLHGVLETSNTEIAYAHDGTHAQYLVALYRKSALQTLPIALEGGVRAVRHYLAQCKAVSVDFADEATCFGNFNLM